MSVLTLIHITALNVNLSYAAGMGNDEIIPNADYYFNPANHAEVWAALSGPMKLFAGILVALGVIGFFATLWFLGKSVLKIVNGVAVGKAMWVGLLTASCISIMLITGTWYQVVKAGHKNFLKPSVQILQQNGPNGTTEQQQTQQQTTEQQQTQKK